MKDITNAFSTYSFNISVESLPLINFPQIENMSFTWPISTLVFLQIDTEYEVKVVDCQSDKTTKSIKFDHESSSLQIDTQDLEEWKSVWVKLMSINSWGNSIYSNEFWVNFNSRYPPSITNSFGPLIVNKGISKLFQIPTDLFTSLQNNKIEYKVSNWIDKIAKQTNIELLKHTSNENSLVVSSFYISVLTFDSFNSWDFLIVASDIFKNSAEYSIQLKIVACSSKDWTEWNVPYQSDWVRCKENYTLQSSGVCLKTSPDRHNNTRIDFYGILGICVAVILIVDVVLIFKLKQISLYPFKYTQIILIFLFSIENPGLNLISFAQWFQWTKLNFGFVYIWIKRKYLLIWRIKENDKCSTLLKEYYSELCFLICWINNYYINLCYCKEVILSI